MILQNVKILLSIDGEDTDQDALLELLIDEATQDYLNFTKQSTIFGAESLIARMAVFLYSRRGKDHLQSQSYSGASESYNLDYPDNIMRGLKSKRKLVMR